MQIACLHTKKTALRVSAVKKNPRPFGPLPHAKHFPIETTSLQNRIGRVTHRAIAAQSTVVLSDGKTSDNIANTVAQAIAVSSSLKLADQAGEA